MAGVQVLFFWRQTSGGIDVCGGWVGTLHLELGRLVWTEGALAQAPVRVALMTPLEHGRPWSLGTSGLGGHLGQLWGQLLCFSGNAGCTVVREGQLDSRAPPGCPRLRLGEGLLVWVGGHPLSGVRAAALGSRERAVVCGTHPGPGSSSIAVHATLFSVQMASSGATLTLELESLALDKRLF